MIQENVDLWKYYENKRYNLFDKLKKRFLLLFFITWIEDRCYLDICVILFNKRLLKPLSILYMNII